jgi:hypothetical protein
MMDIDHFDSAASSLFRWLEAIGEDVYTTGATWVWNLGGNEVEFSAWMTSSEADATRRLAEALLKREAEPTSAQDLIDEMAPRVSEVVAELRETMTWDGGHDLSHIIDELAQCATILTLASATGDVSADHWRKVDGDKACPTCGGGGQVEDVMIGARKPLISDCMHCAGRGVLPAHGREFREPEASSHSAGDCEN